MEEIGFYHKPQYIKNFSKHLKHNQTAAEKIIRHYLKAKKFHWFKFHRQKPLFVYREQSWIDRFFIADFYHHPSKLIIEIDGSIHDRKDVKDYDEFREHLLKQRDYRVVRFTNDMVESDIEWVLQQIFYSIPNPSSETEEGNSPLYFRGGKGE